MRLLLVEDEPALARYLKKGLEEQGHAVDVCGDGLSALEWAHVAPFDVLVLDLSLPKLDGIEVCRRLRAEKCATPILMLTARDSFSDRVLGLDSGADDYLSKPFNFDELLARLRALSRRPSGAVQSTRLKAGNLEVDAATRQVTVDGVRVDLHAKEFAILELLIRQPGRIFSREQIVDRIWDIEALHQSNVVEVHVCNLRRCLRSLGQDVVQTVRGSGYRLQVSHPR